MIYKYLKREHAELLLSKGRLRLGTLYEYRDIEKHGDVIGDEEEGKKSIYMDGNNVTWTAENQPDFGKDFFKLENGASVTFQGVTLEKPVQSPNYYMYCTTSVIDEAALHDFGYDSCVIIENPDKFFAAISHVIRHKGEYEGYFPCRYQSRRVNHLHDDGIHPALIKSLDYKKQREVRAFWRPKKEMIEPIIIDCPKVRKYCRII